MSEKVRESVLCSIRVAKGAGVLQTFKATVGSIVFRQDPEQKTAQLHGGGEQMVPVTSLLFIERHNEIGGCQRSRMAFTGART